MVLHSPSLSLFASNNTLLSNKLLFRYAYPFLCCMLCMCSLLLFKILLLVVRNHTGMIINPKKCGLSEEKRQPSCYSQKPSSQNWIFRRDLVHIGLASVSVTLPLSGRLILITRAISIALYVHNLNWVLIYTLHPPLLFRETKWIVNCKLQISLSFVNLRLMHFFHFIGHVQEFTAYLNYHSFPFIFQLLQLLLLRKSWKWLQ